MTNAFPPKDPAAVLDYEFDWSAWLAEGETITGTPIIEAPGLNVNPDAKTTQVVDGKVTFWLGGGTAESFYDVACKVTTSAGRTDRRTAQLRVAAR